ncbi:MAG: polyprenyl synthetase [Desulfobacca sp.]|nr:polyprenyl synthetase [Desulfobacca sp.]
MGAFKHNPFCLKRRKSKLTNKLAKEFKKFQKLVDEGLKVFLPQPETYAHRVRKAMAYSLLVGGKRIRPILCLMACKAVGGRPIKALPAACALEYIHTYSLIHDDLPAIDNDEYRRGHLTCHKKFGEATAILAGDALLTEAFSLLSRKEILSRIPAQTKLQVIQEMARAAGIQGMVAGQEADLAAEKKKVSLNCLRYIHQHKTGALITASLVCGGLIGGGTAGEIRALRKFGGKIGLAFQIKDDLLNVEGQAEIMGKETGTDEKRAKATYPTLMGLEQSKTLGQELLLEGNRAIRIFGNKALPLIQIGTYILSREQ